MTRGHAGGLLVLLGALGCSAEPASPPDPTAPADPLAALAARFPGAEAWLDDRRPARVEKDVGRWWLREEPSAAASGSWRSLRRDLALGVSPASPGRQIITSARGVELAVERDGVAQIDRHGDALALRDEDGRLAGAIYATPRGIEELFVGVGEARYTLELPMGWSLHQPEGRHELVELRNRRGTPQIRLVARWAWDEDGEQHPVRLRVDDDGVIVQAPRDEGPLLIDPEWQDAGKPSQDRVGALITRLADGRVLLAGGGFSDAFGNGFVPTVTADRFDPRTGTFEGVAELPDATSLGSATLLPDGRVLLAGFAFAPQPPPVVFLPSSGRSESLVADPLPLGHVAARLPDGRVLLAGGFAETGQQPTPGIDSIWLFDPKDDTFEPAGTMVYPRDQAQAIVLDDGKVLLVGGTHLDQPVLSVERYDPSTQQSQEVGTLPAGDAALLLPQLDQFLHLSGTDATLIDVDDTTSTPVGTFDPPRYAAYTALLPDGDALLLGGFGDTMLTLPSQAHRYDAFDNQLVPLPPPPDTFTLTSGAPLPTGDHLVLGDTDEQAWRFDPGAHDVVFVADPLPTPMTAPSITPLPSGEILLSEGGDAVRFDPVSRTSVAEPGALPGIGDGHRATVLLDGRVLFTGGLISTGQATAAAVVYDPGGGAPEVHAMTATRAWHQQALLPDGRVLVVGGVAQAIANFVTSAEIFDPTSGAFTSLGPHPLMAYGDALVLADGKVHIWGGFAPELGALAGEPIVSVFDPSTEIFTLGDGLASASTLAARLPDGRLFALGGDGNAQVRDPLGAEPLELTHSFWQVGVDEPLLPPSIVPLPSGKLLIARADSDIMHLVDPVDLSVTTFAEPAGGRRAAALLPDGGVLLAGAIGGGPAMASLSIWYEHPQRDAWRPSLTAPATLTIGETAALGGTGLVGVSEGVSAWTSGAANAPVAYLLLDGGGIVRGSATDWSATALSFTPEAFPVRGPATIFASPQGLLAGARTVLALDPDGAACDGASTCASGRCVDGVCCASACDDLCFACAASVKGYGADGVCEPLAAGEPDPSCPQDDVVTCKNPGTCDGEGQCAPRYDDFTDCDDGGDRFCYAGACEQRICDGDHTLLFENSTEDCAPYRCVSEPVVACRTSCGSNLDCVEGFLCDASGQCVEGFPAAEPLGCTPCALGRRDDHRASWAWLLLGALLIVRRELSAGHSDEAPRRGDDVIPGVCKRHGHCERRRS